MLGTVLKYRSYPNDTQNPIQYLLIGHTVEEGTPHQLFSRSGIRSVVGVGWGDWFFLFLKRKDTQQRMEMSSWSQAENVVATKMKKPPRFSS